MGETFKERVIAVILTEMGSDGTQELQKVKENNGYCLIRGEKPSVVYLNYARKQLNENGGILKNRIFPVNEKTYKKIYNDLLNIQECFCTN